MTRSLRRRLWLMGHTSKSVTIYWVINHDRPVDSPSLNSSVVHYITAYRQHNVEPFRCVGGTHVVTNRRVRRRLHAIGSENETMTVSPAAVYGKTRHTNLIPGGGGGRDNANKIAISDHPLPLSVSDCLACSQ